jgi:hypothetical protein
MADSASPREKRDKDKKDKDKDKDKDKEKEKEKSEKETGSSKAAPSKSKLKIEDVDDVSENEQRIIQKLKEERRGPASFEKIRLIGKGGVGRVYLVRLKDTNELFAMKVLKKSEMIQRNKVRRRCGDNSTAGTSSPCTPLVDEFFLAWGCLLTHTITYSKVHTA